MTDETQLLKVNGLFYQQSLVDYLNISVSFTEGLLGGTMFRIVTLLSPHSPSKSMISLS